MQRKGAFLCTFAACAMFLGGCETTQPAVEIREVRVPVPQPCLSAQQLADLPEPPLVGHLLGRTHETAAQDRDILGASAIRLRSWGQALFAAHAACVER